MVQVERASALATIQHVVDSMQPGDKASIVDLHRLPLSYNNMAVHSEMVDLLQQFGVLTTAIRRSVIAAVCQECMHADERSAIAEGLLAKRTFRHRSWTPQRNEALLHFADTMTYDTGPQKGQPRMNDIAKALEGEFHEAFKAANVKRQIHRLRKRVRVILDRDDSATADAAPANVDVVTS